MPKESRKKAKINRKKYNNRLSKHTTEVNKAISWYFETNNKIECSEENNPIKEELKCINNQCQE